MNIQINCNTDNIDSYSLRYIYYNLQNFIDKYNSEKDDVFKTRNGIWKYNSKGNSLVTLNIDIKCNGKTMYFKIKE